MPMWFLFIYVLIYFSTICFYTGLQQARISFKAVLKWTSNGVHSVRVSRLSKPSLGFLEFRLCTCGNSYNPQSRYITARCRDPISAADGQKVPRGRKRRGRSELPSSWGLWQVKTSLFSQPRLQVTIPAPILCNYLRPGCRKFLGPSRAFLTVESPVDFKIWTGNTHVKVECLAASVPDLEFSGTS